MHSLKPAPQRALPAHTKSAVDPARAEREADDVAHRVVTHASLAGWGRRGCPCGGGCPRCRPAASNSAPAPAPAHVAQALASGGRPLEAADRRFMESRFGVDFSGVRVHDGARARTTAESLGAEAFAFGEHVVFGAAASRRRERRLLAHELAHVLQQRASGARVQRKDKPKPAAVPADDPAFLEWWKLVTGFEGPLAAWMANPANAADKGGQTNWGVTKQGYLQHAKALGLDPTEEGFAALTPEQAMRFGRMMWKASGASRIKNPGVAIVLADWYWGGITLRRLTALLKAKGHVGSYDKGSPSQATTDFINTLPPEELIELMSDAKAEQYRAHAKEDPTQQQFLAGWLKRSETRRTQARQFAAPPEADADAQLSLWERAQRALGQAARAETADERAAACKRLQAAIAAIDRREAAGFAHEEEADSMRRLRDELRQALARIGG